MTALYSPEAMVDLMIAEPHITPKQLAMRFGRPRSWLSSVLASEDFQAALAPRRSEISNPAFTASLRERFAALAIAAGDVLMERMDREGEEQPTEFLLVKTAEVSMKALGLGQRNVLEVQAAPKTAEQLTSDALADRLVTEFAKHQKLRTIDGEVEVHHEAV